MDQRSDFFRIRERLYPPGYQQLTCLAHAKFARATSLDRAGVAVSIAPRLRDTLGKLSSARFRYTCTYMHNITEEWQL